MPAIRTTENISLRRASLTKGFEVTGTLGVLRLAARRGLIDLVDTLAKLKRTNFRYRQKMIDDLLDEFFGRA